MTAELAENQKLPTLRRFFRKLRRSLRPPATGWVRLFLFELAWLAPVVALCGNFGGWIAWQPDFSADTFKLLAIALIAPALGEELLFRAALLPAPAPERSLPLGAIAFSTLLFAAWHPFQTLVHDGPFAQLMLEPTFLLAVIALGVACARLYWRSGSIWPAVALHWLVVAVFKALFGAPLPW
ncbi:CPBP family glutamic-type intramembrane protease [Alteriqipengyuania flavescens]|uniref:CPBP family glutamic-type intramembrane protease n=1 Tax=Alteriqipengyuania flavescens TaxID=3053610 RepID=UPI0025B5A5C1|nr:CPBP family glutamic-type intramembrane protease [Alteriqipengyuania flavescens]WJY17912.1 CPBP family glutamic-type intramembrane protease [Alteriqipengyuania flavescens]WJY23853.1 CPBP family glutamic-type intramembrane protease [Alteriqipengyuania flavescens]